MINPRLTLEQGPDRRLVRHVGDDRPHPPPSRADLSGIAKAFDRSPESVLGSASDRDGRPLGQRQPGRLQADPGTAADHNQMLTLKSHSHFLKESVAFRFAERPGSVAGPAARTLNP